MKRLALILVLTALCLGLHARTAADFFVDAPQSVIPLLDRNERLDMLDYYRSQLPPKTTDAVGTPVHIDSESESLVTLSSADSAATQLGVITQGADTLIVVIETLPISIGDSRVTLYRPGWQPYSKSPVLEPTLSDWLTKEGNARRKEIEEWLPFMTATATVDPEAGTVTFTRTIDQYFARNDQQAAELLPLLKPQLKFNLK